MSGPRIHRGMTVAALESLISEDQEKVVDLQTALSNKNKVAPDGSRLDAAEYFKWRHSVLNNLNQRLKRLRASKDLLKKMRAKPPRALDTTEGLLRAALAIIRGLEDLSGEETMVRDAIESHLRRQTVVELQ